MNYIVKVQFNYTPSGKFQNLEITRRDGTIRQYTTRRERLFYALPKAWESIYTKTAVIVSR